MREQPFLPSADGEPSTVFRTTTANDLLVFELTKDGGRGYHNLTVRGLYRYGALLNLLFGTLQKDSSVGQSVYWTRCIWMSLDSSHTFQFSIPLPTEGRMRSRMMKMLFKLETSPRQRQKNRLQFLNHHHRTDMCVHITRPSHFALHLIPLIEVRLLVLQLLFANALAATFTLVIYDGW